MNTSSRPTTVRVLGSSLVSNPSSPQFRGYVYNGTDKFVPPAKPEPVKEECCAAAGCMREVHAQGYCSTHYRKVKRGVALDFDGRNKPFDPSFCGTVRGYSRHYSHGQKPCRECLDAKNAYDRARRAGKRAAA